MKKEQVAGLFREILTLVGALAFAHFQDGWEAITGLVVAIIMILWALIKHEGLGIVFTSIRKALSLIPGLLVYFEVLRTDQAELIIAMIGPIAAMVWSVIGKGPMPLDGAKFLWILVLIFSFSSIGCGIDNFQFGYIDPKTGASIGGTYSAKEGVSIISNYSTK